jgi:thiosulfate dehydrogenase [quinone] large subunit
MHRTRLVATDLGRRQAVSSGNGEGPMSPITAPPDFMWKMHRDDGTVATGWFLLPLRLFLGVTFLFAGLQKLANPDFFKSSSPISIHAQLVGGTHSSPIHALLTHLVPIAPAVGLVVSIGEVAIGLGVLVGLWTRVAAVAGMALSFGLFLTVSYHSSPYFTGSDIVFFFAWTPLALAGAAGAPALDTFLAARRPTASAGPDDVSRRAVLSRGAFAGIAAAVVLVTAGLASALGRAAGGTTTAAGSPNPLVPTGSTSTTTTAPVSTTTEPGATTTAPLPSGTSIGTAASVPIGGAATFTDPASGDPSLVIQATADDFVAFDAVCPHAGCTVAYQTASKIIACPCHGSEFNPRTGDVTRGPAPSGLGKISVIKGSNGDLYVPK